MVRVLDPDAAQRLLELKDRALSSTAEGVTISDCRLRNNPIIYANEGFERITGYSISEVTGRNCKFLQGEGTDPAAIEEIRRGLRENRELTVEILNYRKDGTPFWNRLSIASPSCLPLWARSPWKAAWIGCYVQLMGAQDRSRSKTTPRFSPSRLQPEVLAAFPNRLLEFSRVSIDRSISLH